MMTTMTATKTGWVPDAIARRILRGNRLDTCAYIYPDGILINEKREARDGKHAVTYTMHHVWHCEIPLRLGNYRSEVDQTPLTRIVCHNARVLLDGVARVELYRGNASTAMEKRGLRCDTLTLTTPAGAEHRSDNWDFMTSDYTAQTGTDTLEEVITYHKDHAYEGDRVEVHA